MYSRRTYDVIRRRDEERMHADSLSREEREIRGIPNPVTSWPDMVEPSIVAPIQIQSLGDVHATRSKQDG